MNLPLRDAFLARVPGAFPGERFELGDGSDVVTFLAKHPEVGNLSVTVEENEFIVFVGSRTHAHFGIATGEFPDQQAKLLVDEVVKFLQQVFADEIEIYGYGGGGGMRQRRATSRGLVSRLLFGWRTYVWSGPLP